MAPETQLSPSWVSYLTHYFLSQMVSLLLVLSVATVLSNDECLSPAMKAIVAVQLTGCNTDCGMVEVKLGDDDRWLGVAATPWTLKHAALACQSVGFDEAVSAKSPRRNSKKRATAVLEEAASSVCGDLASCYRVVDVVDSRQGVGVSCRSAGQAVGNATAVAEWKERARARAVRVNQALLHASTPPKSPFTQQMLNDAYVFADELRDEWHLMDSMLSARLLLRDHYPTSALGVMLPSNETEAEIAAELYLSTNPHSQFLYETDYAAWQQVPIIDDIRAEEIAEALASDGVAMISSYGLSDSQLDELERQARAAVSGPKNLSVASNGRVATARVELPAVEQILGNTTISSALKRFLGSPHIVLDGYKATELRTTTTSTDAYIASLWHHDRVGRRIKLFIYVHDVDCDAGHPTQIAKKSHKLFYYRTDHFAATRFTDAYVQANFDILKACGPRGGGFIFDTNTVHKGTPEGDQDRLTIIAEFHASHKCPAATALNLGLPCPSGDQFPLSRHL